MNVSITPLVSKSGERIGRLLLFDDVTQRERMEEQMTQTEKLTSLGLLAAGVAHEVNTPLAVISNYIQMLAKQMPEGDPQQAIIEKIVKQTFRASEIVNNLLNFSRTSAAEVVDIDVNRVVEETLSLVAHPLKTSQIQVVQAVGRNASGGARVRQQTAAGIFEFIFECARRHARRRNAGSAHHRTQWQRGSGNCRHRRGNSRASTFTEFSIRSLPPRPAAAEPDWAFR